MTYRVLEQLCRESALQIIGGFSVDPALDSELSGFKTLIMLGPDEPAFWPVFKSSEEFKARENPMDHWSKRVIGKLALRLGGKTFFPSDGPPYPPFFSWATRTERCHGSPINLLVHDRAGLMVSFRGALALREEIALPQPPEKPCKTCSDMPCVSSCPIGALTPKGYDVDACKSYLKTPDG